MEKFKNKYRIQSTRMPGWDYARGGKYYVTICTHKMVCYFGDIIHGEMRLNEIGKIVNDFWLKIPEHFNDTYLDDHIVMPNHIHGIIVMKRVNTRHVQTPNLGISSSPQTPNLDVSTSQNHITTPIKTPKITIPNWTSGSLGVIINQFKRICTIKIKSHRHVQTLNLGVSSSHGTPNLGVSSPPETLELGVSTFRWHPRFYDEIIRNHERLQQIRAYIRNNPANWNNDEHFKSP